MITIKPPFRGMNTDIDPKLLSPKWCQLAENMVLNNGVLEPERKYNFVLEESPSNRITGIFDVVISDTPATIMIVHQQTMPKLYNSSFSFLQHVITETFLNSLFQTVHTWISIPQGLLGFRVNGVPIFIFFDVNTYRARLLVKEEALDLIAPQIIARDFGNVFEFYSGANSWIISYIDDQIDIESELAQTQIFNVPAPDGTGFSVFHTQIQRTNGSPLNMENLRIYRRQVSGGPDHLLIPPELYQEMPVAFPDVIDTNRVGIFGNNSPNLIIWDLVANDQLSAEIALSKILMGKATSAVLHVDNRIYIANKNVINFSLPSRPVEIEPVIGEFVVGEGTDIVDLKSYISQLIIPKTDSAFVMAGFPPDHVLIKIVHGHGAVARLVEADQKLYVLSKDGFFQFNAVTFSGNLANPVWEKGLKLNIEEFSLSVDSARKNIYLTMSNGKAFIYNWQSDGWTKSGVVGARQTINNELILFENFSVFQIIDELPTNVISNYKTIILNQGVTIKDKHWLSLSYDISRLTELGIGWKMINKTGVVSFEDGNQTIQLDENFLRLSGRSRGLELDIFAKQLSINEIMVDTQVLNKRS